jgi:hypothetical protein
VAELEIEGGRGVRSRRSHEWRIKGIYQTQSSDIMTEKEKEKELNLCYFLIE